MDIHPVRLRALKWKLGEVKLSKEEEAQLALDFCLLVTGDAPIGGSLHPIDHSASYVPVSYAATIGRPKGKKTPVTRVTSKEPPKTIIDRVVTVLGTRRLTPNSVYQFFRQQHWSGSESTVRKVMYRGVKDKVLKRVADGVYAVR